MCWIQGTILCALSFNNLGVCRPFPLLVRAVGCVAVRQLEERAIKRLSRDRWHIQETGVCKSKLGKFGRRVVRFAWNPVHITFDLKWAGQEVTVNQIHELHRIRHVQGLVFHGADLDDSLLKHIASMKGVRFLSVDFAPKVTDQGVAHLCNMRTIRQLSLAGVTIVGASVLQDLEL